MSNNQQGPGQPFSPVPLYDFSTTRLIDGGPTYDITQMNENELRWALWMACGIMTSSECDLRSVHSKTDETLSAVKLLGKVMMDKSYIEELYDYLDIQYKSDKLLAEHRVKYPDSDGPDGSLESLFRAFQPEE